MEPIFSDRYPQENGTPQSNIFTPVNKVNTVVIAVSRNANTSLFVYDSAACIDGKHLKHLNRTMQLYIDVI